jgi:hypothetical protein
MAAEGGAAEGGAAEGDEDEDFGAAASPAVSEAEVGSGVTVFRSILSSSSPQPLHEVNSSWFPTAAGLSATVQ